MVEPWCTRPLQIWHWENAGQPCQNLVVQEKVFVWSVGMPGVAVEGLVRGQRVSDGQFDSGQLSQVEREEVWDGLRMNIEFREAVFELHFPEDTMREAACHRAGWPARLKLPLMDFVAPCADSSVCEVKLGRDARTRGRLVIRRIHRT